MVEGHVRAADGAAVEQVAHEPRRGIAAEVLGHGEDAVVAPGRLDDAVAAPDGDGQGLLHHDVQPQVEGLAGDGVVVAWIDDDVDGVQVGDLPGHPLQVGEDLGPRAEELLRLAGGELPVLRADVADGGQLDVGEGRLRQLGESVEVAGAHAAAADEGDSNPVHGISESASGRCAFVSGRPRKARAGLPASVRKGPRAA